MKRVIDITAAFLGLVLLLPLFFAIAFTILVTSGRPIFFKQMRLGLLAEPFLLVKFRTMRNDRDANGSLLSDSDRLTRVGAFLRSTSMDELPELWNVLKGDMSLVGPRPLLLDYLPLYSPEQMRRHEVRPGITGWAQVNGRNTLIWPVRLQHDVWYVDNRSLRLDFLILLKTFRKVVAREGISEPGEATATRFRGTEKNEWEK